MSHIKYLINRKWQINKLNVALEWRSKKNLIGRFGGGWNWNVGVQWGSRDLILNLLVFMIRMSWGK